jgi:hypothetical protein
VINILPPRWNRWYISLSKTFTILQLPNPVLEFTFVTAWSSLPSSIDSQVLTSRRSVSNGSGKPASSSVCGRQFSLVWFLTQTKTRPALPWRECNPDQTSTNSCSAVLEPDQVPNLTVPTPLVAMQYWSSHQIMTSSVDWFCFLCRSSSSSFPIQDRTDIQWEGVNNGHIVSENMGVFSSD